MPALAEAAARLREFPRVATGTFPTPLHRLPRASAALGRELWMKRDDLTGAALGGNKIRKLQFLIGDALASGCDTVIATGYVQSNNVVQTAAVASAHGLRSVLVLTGDDPGVRRGNLVLAEYLGAELVFVGATPQMEALAAEAERLRRDGARLYVLPPGGSTPIGILGFVEAAFEAQAQCAALGIAPDCILFPTGTGGTQAGLALGLALAGWDAILYGISTGTAGAAMIAAMHPLIAAARGLLGVPEDLALPDLIVDDRFYGAGYAKPNAEDYAAIGAFAKLEGLFLDPVYTGRAMKGLEHLQDAGELPGTGPVLFWNTGGSPALFAFDV